MANNVKEISKLEEELDKLKQEIRNIEGQIGVIDAKIDRYVMDIQMYEEVHATYFKGWIYAIDKELAIPKKEKNEIKIKCQEVADVHRNKVLGEENGEQVLRNVS